jgi:hypothetical protein
MAWILLVVLIIAAGVMAAAWMFNEPADIPREDEVTELRRWEDSER